MLGTMPPHIGWYLLNYHKVPPTHFAVFQETILTLVAPLEAQGYTMPSRLVPEISQGKFFAKYARNELGIDTSSLPTMDWTYPDGRIVEAKLYPIQHLGTFRTFLLTQWMPNEAERYFRERDPTALPFLAVILKY